MKEMLKKEYLFGLRNAKFLVVSFTYLFFAISVPVMVKVLLPAVLKSQFPGMSEADMAMMIDISQFGSLTNYAKNIFEIGLIVVAFTLSGLMATEMKDNTLVIPICSGQGFRPIVLSKFIVQAIALTVVTFVSLVVTYYYSSIIFDQDVVFGAIAKTALLESILAVFVVALIITFGTFVKKPIGTGLLTVGTVYVLSFVGSLFDITNYLPSGLHTEAIQFTNSFPTEVWGTIGITVVLTGLLLFLTMKQLEAAEWNQR